MDSTTSLTERVERFPEPWKPKAGDKIVGVVSGLDKRDSEYGDEPYPIVTINADGSEVAVHGFHTVLKNELARQRPRVGDEIAIKYFGKDEAKGYERYRVIVEHADAPEGEVDWDAMAESETEAGGWDLPSGPANATT